MIDNDSLMNAFMNAMENDRNPEKRKQSIRKRIADKVQFVPSISEADKQKAVESIMGAMGLFEPIVGSAVAHIDDTQTYYIRKVDGDIITVGVEPGGEDEVKQFHVSEGMLFDPNLAVDFTTAMIRHAQEKGVKNN